MGASGKSAVVPDWNTSYRGGAANDCGDLTQCEGKSARGQHIVLTGRIVEAGTIPVGNAIVEIWQADANGVFRHSLDPRCEKADPGFFGWGRARTNVEGRYCFRAVVPGSYSGRRPHVNLLVLANRVDAPAGDDGILRGFRQARLMIRS